MNLTESLVPRVLDTGMKTTGVHYYSWLIYPSYRINSKQNRLRTWPTGNPLNWTTKIGAIHAGLSNQRTWTHRDHRSSDPETPAWRSLDQTRSSRNMRDRHRKGSRRIWTRRNPGP